MAKLYIRIHESKISKMRNRDLYYEWIASEDSPAPQCMNADSGIHPYFPIYVDNPDKPVYDEATLNANLKKVMGYIDKTISTIPGFGDVAEYFDFDLVDGGVCDVDIVIKPKDVLWDENFEDIKYLTKKAVRMIDDACSEGIFSEDSLCKAGLVSDACV